MLVKDFLKEHPDSIFRMMTPRGYIDLLPQQVKKILEGEAANAHLGAFSDIEAYKMKVAAKELLAESVISANWRNDICYMITDCSKEAQTLISKEKK